jgi:hypothetical protein
MLCLCIIRDCSSMSGSTILIYIYHLCALDVVASGIDVELCRVLVTYGDGGIGTIEWQLSAERKQTRGCS